MAKQPVHSFPDRKSANKAFFFLFYFQSSIYVGYNTILNLLFTYFSRIHILQTQEGKNITSFSR